MHRPARDALLLVLLLASCSGAVQGDGTDEPGPTSGGGGGSGGGPGPGAGGSTGMQLPPGDARAAGPMYLRRLTRAEYNNVVKDLIGDGNNLGNALTPEASGSSGYSTPGLLTEVDVQTLADNAERLTMNVTAKIPTLVACDPVKSGEPACAEAFIRQFGKRAYRRPLTEDEVAYHKDFYQAKVRTGLGLAHADAMKVLLTAMLQAPPFLYHWELGLVAPTRDGAVLKLNPYEVASRLSFTLWQTLPDAELFTSADSGELGTAAGVEKQARRMLASPRAATAVMSFYKEWLDVDAIDTVAKDKTRYPLFVPGASGDMQQELLTFVRSVVLDGDGALKGLLTSPVAFVNDRIAPIYGAPKPGSNTLTKAMLDPAQRPGLLTRLAILTVKANAYEGNPTMRGKLVREHFLCQTPPPPPPGVPPLATDPKLPVRVRREMHVKDPACASCHTLMDPIGFGLENYDAIGAWRTQDAGQPVDASGKVSAIDGGDRAFSGPGDLMQVLAGSDDVRRCVARQWMQYAYGRGLDMPDDASLAATFAAFSRTGFNLRELMVATVLSRSFLYRSPATGEVLQ